MKLTAIALMLVLLATACPVVAHAAGVSIEITSIVASMELPKQERNAPVPVIDPKLTQYGKKLESLFAYKKYSYGGASRSEARFGTSCTFQLPERFSLEVEPERFDPEGHGRVEMLVTLFRDVRADDGAGDDPRGRATRKEIVLRTRIRLENGGVVLLGGPPLRDGVLILALSARQ
jgi:hypothetical protein